MAAHPLTAVLPLLGDILVECPMVVTDAQGHVLGGDGAQHHFTSIAASIRDPETGAIVGAVDVTGPDYTVHPTTSALVAAAARLAEGFLRAQVAVREARHLARLGDAPGALLAPDGRVLVAEPPGWLPPQVALPAAGDRMLLPDGSEGVLVPLADGWLLRPAGPVSRSPLPAA